MKVDEHIAPFAVGVFGILLLVWGWGEAPWWVRGMTAGYGLIKFSSSWHSEIRNDQATKKDPQ